MASVQNYLAELQEKRSKRRIYVRFAAAGAAALALVLAFFWITFWSPVFKYSSLVVVLNGKEALDHPLIAELEKMNSASFCL